jgi:FtsZ-binding cell division protein ZapB
LKREKEALEDKVSRLASDNDQAIQSLKAENAALSEELDSLKAERKQVRSRIEKLLGQMDVLAG